MCKEGWEIWQKRKVGIRFVGIQECEKISFQEKELPERNMYRIRRFEES